MTITAIDGTHARLNGKSILLSTILVNLVAGAFLQIVDKSNNQDILPLTKWDAIQNGATGLPYASQTEFQTAMTAVFGIVAPAGVALATTATPGIVKKVAASANTATSPGAAYVQAEAVAVYAELRDLKAKMQTAGLLT